MARPAISHIHLPSGRPVPRSVRYPAGQWFWLFPRFTAGLFTPPFAVTRAKASSPSAMCTFNRQSKPDRYSRISLARGQSSPALGLRHLQAVIPLFGISPRLESASDSRRRGRGLRWCGGATVRWLNAQATQGVDRLGCGEQEIEQPHCTQAVTVVLTRAAPNRRIRCLQFQCGGLDGRRLLFGQYQHR